MPRFAHRRSTFLSALMVAVLAVALGSAQEPKPGFADPLLGRWDLTVQGPDGPYPSWLEVRLRKETEIMGRFVGRFGSMRHVSELSYDNGRVVATIPVQYEQHESDLRFEGQLEGDTLKGTTQDADGRTLIWTGVRAPALLRESDVAWGEPIDLFNGHDLSGWKLRSAERPGCWAVSGGELVSTPPCVDLVSDRAFEDFKLHVEFMYPNGSNSGIYLRGRYEVQIQDDAGRALDPLRMGGVYGFLRPSVDAAGPAGEWQTFDITLAGRRITAVLNGTTIIRDEEIPGITGGALDSNEGMSGPLMLQGDHGKITFRAITLTPAR